ncbi:MAG: trimethylamine methyltransferase family protein [Thermodesulfobacteriota bacterium]
MPYTRFAYLSPIQVEMLRDKVLAFLEGRGVKMDHPEILALLARAGAKVEDSSGQVRFPKRFVREQLDKTKKAFTLYGRDGTRALPFPHPRGLFYSRSGTGAMNWIEPDSGAYRRTVLADIAIWGQLMSRLDGVDFVPYITPTDMPAATADIHALKAMLENTDKHVWVQPYSGESIVYLMELLKAAAGGEDRLREKPQASLITCSLTPLEFKHMDLEIILQGARAGVPLFPCSLPTAGTTAPVTGPASVLLAAIENLTMIVTAQVVSPGIPVVPTSLQFSADMRTGGSLQSSVEAMRQSALFVQLIKEGFGLLAHTYGSGSDSPLIDGQSMIERALLSQHIAASGADILGGVGQLEVATTVSPLQAVIDSEVMEIVKRLMQEVNLDDESLGLKVLQACKPGGEFLTHEHTLTHCRETFQPRLFIRKSRNMWESGEKKDLLQRAADEYERIMASAGPVEMSESRVTEMQRIVEKADKKLV